MNRRCWKTYITAPLLTLAILLSSGCSRSSGPVSRTGLYFDTVISVTVYDSEDTALLEECFAIADTYEHMFSRTIEGSDIWNINHAQGAAVSVNDDTISLLNSALYYARITDGRIDPTISIVKDLWDFTGERHSELPENADIRKALTHVDYRNIIISGGSVRLKDPDASIDLGFIAKGFIADRMTDYLKEKGVKSAVINLGGNVAVIGSKPDGSPFRIGIQKPFAPSGDSIATLSITGLSAVTSGSYERYFKLDGQLYHHILDAKTGYPVWNNLSGVTIISESSMEADALSTACFVLGLTEGEELIASLENVEALFITSDGGLHAAGGLELP